MNPVRAARMRKARFPYRPDRFVSRAARFCIRFATDASFRSVARLRMAAPPNLFQPFSETALDRYPSIFSFARETLGDEPERRLLSFGCSTGEEAFSLRRYFPRAFITGLDINPRSISRARATLARARSGDGVRNRLVDGGRTGGVL